MVFSQNMLLGDLSNHSDGANNSVWSHRFQVIRLLWQIRPAMVNLRKEGNLCIQVLTKGGREGDNEGIWSFLRGLCGVGNGHHSRVTHYATARSIGREICVWWLERSAPCLNECDDKRKCTQACTWRASILLAELLAAEDRLLPLVKAKLLLERLHIRESNKMKIEGNPQQQILENLQVGKSEYLIDLFFD